MSKSPVSGGSLGSLGKQTPIVGQGGIGMPGGMVPPPNVNQLKGGGKFAMRSAQGSMGQPRPRPMTRPGTGLM